MPKASLLSRCLALIILLCGTPCLLLTAAPPGAKLVVSIKNGKPTPSNLDVTQRKVDLVYFQNNDTGPYKIVWTDKNYGSPFVAPNSPPDKGTFTLQPFTGPSGQG